MSGLSNWMRGTMRLFLIKAVVMVGLLVLVVAFAGRDQIINTVLNASFLSLLFGLVLTIPQIILSALRWQWISETLGIPLRLRTAIAEYYVAGFLNQTLPGGVAGEGVRIYRQGQAIKGKAKEAGAQPGTMGSKEGVKKAGKQGEGLHDYGRAAKPVVFERAFGQIMMLICAVPGLSLFSPALAWLAGSVLAGLCLCAWIFGDPDTDRKTRLAWAKCLAGEFKISVLQGAAFWRHAFASFLVTASYIAVFWLSALSIGVELPFGKALLILPPALAIMALPITPAGWGLREGASAVLWSAAGLSLSDGVAASLIYGVVNLVAVSPGLLLLWRKPTRL